MPRFLSSIGLLLVPGMLAACEASSGDGGTAVTTDAETGDTGGLIEPQAGDYLVEIVKKTGMCRTEEEMASWTLTMPVPDQDGSWELTEEYSGEDILRQEPYPCNLTGVDGICSIDKSHDYGAEGGPVADVYAAKRSWEFTWITDTELEGRVSVDLRCTGSGCPEVAADYLVNEWDCETNAEFTGTLK